MSLNSEKLKIRPANWDDCQLLWQWANEAEVRNWFFSSEFISWETHQEWFQQKLQEPNYYIFIGLDRQNKPVGQARFAIEDSNSAAISISIDSEKRGRGYGSLLLKKTINRIFTQTSVKIIHAWVKTENTASQKMFEKAGFINIEVQKIKESLAWHYQKVKSDRGD